VYAPPEQGAPLAVDGGELFLRELTVTSSWSAGAADMRAALALLRSGAVRTDELITHRFGLDETGAALAAQRDGTALKAVVLP
jgi:threonine dehydrogenase-like Zn-dependent dehydrogenase